MTAIYIRLDKTSRKVEKTVEVLADRIFVDWDYLGIVGIEILFSAEQIDVDGEHVWRLGDS